MVEFLFMDSWIPTISKIKCSFKSLHREESMGCDIDNTWFNHKIVKFDACWNKWLHGLPFVLSQSWSIERYFTDKAMQVSIVKNRFLFTCFK